MAISIYSSLGGVIGEVTVAEEGVKLITYGKTVLLSYDQIRYINGTRGTVYRGLLLMPFDPSMQPFPINGLKRKDTNLLYRAIQGHRARALKGDQDGRFREAINALDELCSHNHFISFRDWSVWREKYLPLLKLIPEDYKNLNLEPQAASDLSRVKQLLRKVNLLEYIDHHNDAFVTSELEKWKDFFNQVEKYPLTEQQQRAIVQDEINNLIIAGAGTGKTSTLMGKVGYILEKGLAKPDEILVLAFTRKAAEEIEQRIEEKFQKELNVRTFHSLGMQILRSQGRKPTLSKFADDEKHLQDFVFKCLTDLISKTHIGKLVMKFLSNYLVPYKSKFSFHSEGEYITYLKTYDIRTLKGEKVKSYGECQIANFLTLNGIPYEYEAKYEHDTSSKIFRQYRPDFYLTRDKIYIEHFGLDKQDNPPPFVDKKKYLDGIKWKRETHKKYGTQLIETYHYEVKSGALQKKLEEEFKAREIKPQRIEKQAFFEKAKESGYIHQLTVLICRFLVLFKSIGETIKSLSKNADANIDNVRVKPFISIFGEIYQAYEDHLKSENEIDFNDMINSAAELVRNRSYVSPFKYILIDEFQDISYSRYKLVKALIDQNPEQKTVCVGDDWQSIYRFASADLSIMTNFSEYFGHTLVSKLDRTFRFSKPLVEFSSKFVTKNPRQISKQLVSFEPGVEKPVCVVMARPDKMGDALTEKLGEISTETLPNRPSVFILGRYKHDKPKGLRYIRKNFPTLDVAFYTMHKSKGLQADYVIIINMWTGKFGFPSEIADDPLLDLVMAKPDGFPNAEERRLFYVAVTRAKKRVYMISSEEEPSLFVTEILGGKNGVSVEYYGHREPPLTCPNCQTGKLVLRHGDFGQFLGCSNYPYCEEKANHCPECGTGFVILSENKSRYICTLKGCNYSGPVCPECGGMLRQKSGKHGPFIGCSNWPDCEHSSNAAR